MSDGVNLTPAQVLELDRLHADAREAWAGYERAAGRALRRLSDILAAAGVPEEERTRAPGWRMVVDGDAVRLVPGEAEKDGQTAGE